MVREAISCKNGVPKPKCCFIY